MFCGKEIQFPFYQSFRQANATTKLFKILAFNRPYVCQLHAFLEQSFVKCEDTMHTQMQTCIDEVVCWSKMILSVTAVDE